MNRSEHHTTIIGEASEYLRLAGEYAAACQNGTLTDSRAAALIDAQGAVIEAMRQCLNAGYDLPAIRLGTVTLCVPENEFNTAGKTVITGYPAPDMGAPVDIRAVLKDCGVSVWEPPHKPWYRRAWEWVFGA